MNSLCSPEGQLLEAAAAMACSLNGLAVAVGQSDKARVEAFMVDIAESLKKQMTLAKTVVDPSQKVWPFTFSLFSLLTIFLTQLSVMVCAANCA